VLGLNLLMGFAGQVSLGHAGFFGHRRLRRRPRPDLSCNTILGGCALAVATLGMGLLIAMVFTNETAITNGPNGMPVPRLELFGWRLSSPVTQAGFLESLAHACQRQRACKLRARPPHPPHQLGLDLRMQRGRNRHRAVARIDAAARNTNLPGMKNCRLCRLPSRTRGSGHDRSTTIMVAASLGMHALADA